MVADPSHIKISFRYFVKPITRYKTHGSPLIKREKEKTLKKLTKIQLNVNRIFRKRDYQSELNTVSWRYIENLNKKMNKKWSIPKKYNVGDKL